MNNTSDDNFDLRSLPSSISLDSTYIPQSLESPLESPLDSPFIISELKYQEQQKKEKEQEEQQEQQEEEQEQQEEEQEEQQEQEEEEKEIGKSSIVKKEKYVWNPVDDIWKKILMSDFYVVKDCAPDGNCQFRSLEEAIKGDSELKASYKKLRGMVAEYILTLSDSEFQEILNNYKACSCLKFEDSINFYIILLIDIKKIRFT
jgi:TolA-binding protein